MPTTPYCITLRKDDLVMDVETKERGRVSRIPTPIGRTVFVVWPGYERGKPTDVLRLRFIPPNNGAKPNNDPEDVPPIEGEAPAVSSGDRRAAAVEAADYDPGIDDILGAFRYCLDTHDEQIAKLTTELEEEKRSRTRFKKAIAILEAK